MTVRTHVAWHWRALGAVALMSVSIVLALWMYEAGRRFAGFDAVAASYELAALQERVAKLEEEAKQLRSVAASAESRVQIEKTAQEKLVAQVKAMESENGRLREDLAFFENMAAGRGEDRVGVSRFKVEQDGAPGEYRYRVLVTQGGKDREFQGRLQLVVHVKHGERDVAVLVPDDASRDAASYRIQFRRFYRGEGTFKVDPAAKVQSVQVRVFEQGIAQPRATHNVTLGAAGSAPREG
jgi:hypothetical protein